MGQSKGSVYYKLMSHKQSQKGQLPFDKVVTTDSVDPVCSQRMEFAIFSAIFHSASCIFSPFMNTNPGWRIKKLLVSELDQFERI